MKQAIIVAALVLTGCQAKLPRELELDCFAHVHSLTHLENEEDLKLIPARIKKACVIMPYPGVLNTEQREAVDAMRKAFAPELFK